MARPLGVVAAGHRCTAEAAAEVLRAGGNAYDAVLAALAAACAAEPVLCTPGGGGFLLARPADGAARVYDFFVQTPSERHALEDIDFRPVLVDFGAVTQEFHIGLGTVAVPGMVRGLFEAHRELGSLPMRDIVAQAVTLAKEGVPVTPFQAYLFDVVKTTYGATDACRRIFASSSIEGSLVREGDVLRQPELADTLEILAHEGDDLFYRGEIAAAVERDMQGEGQVTRADLAAYRVERRAPLARDYRGVRVYTNPPPSSGGLLIAFGLELLASQSLVGIEPGEARHLELLARVLEATTEARIAAHAEGASLAAEQLLDEALLGRYRREIAGRLASRRGTTHMSVIDGAGNLASLTVSNGEGSGYVVPGTGVVMNNMLGEEDLNPGGFQRWQAGQRMTSMMAPSALQWSDGTLVATGSGGSNRLRTAILQVIVNVIDFALPIEEAVRAPRIHFENGHLSVEGGFDVEQLGPLLDKFPNHQIWEDLNLFFGGAHTVRAQDDDMQGAGDPRRDGASMVCVA